MEIPSPSVSVPGVHAGGGCTGGTMIRRRIWPRAVFFLMRAVIRSFSVLPAGVRSSVALTALAFGFFAPLSLRGFARATIFLPETTSKRNFAVFFVLTESLSVRPSSVARLALILAFLRVIGLRFAAVVAFVLPGAAQPRSAARSRVARASAMVSGDGICSVTQTQYPVRYVVAGTAAVVRTRNAFGTPQPREEASAPLRRPSPSASPSTASRMPSRSVSLADRWPSRSASACRPR